MVNKIKNRYNRIARFYDLFEGPMEIFFSRSRTELLSEAKGKTLEVGIGTGKNIPFYPRNVELVGIDFSEKMVEIANRKAKNNPRIQIRLMDVENMDFEDDSFDTVVTSCVFCSVPNPVQGLKEIRRVCKDGGKLLMLEHVRSQRRIIGKIMDIFNFIPLYLYGANMNRKTYDNLLKAGFAPDQIRGKNMWLDILKLMRISNDKSKEARL